MQLLLRVFIGIELAVAGEAVDAMHLQMFIEGGHTQKFLQRRLIHALYNSEAHVVVDQRENPIGLVIREAQTAADLGGHFYSDVDVSIEADAVGRDSEGRRLAYV